MMKKLTLINANTENFGAGDVVVINFRLGLDEMHQVYLDPDRNIDFESFEYPHDEDREKIESWVTQWVREHHNEISKLISDSVFGSNDFVSDKQLFGTWLGGWGVFKFVGSDDEIAVAVCNQSDDVLRIDRKAKVFSNESEYNEWYEKMEGNDYYGDANIVNRAIFDIQGEEY